MEEIIREIVDADKQARRRVKEKQQERLNIQNLIQQQDDEIKSRYQQETKALLEETGRTECSFTKRTRAGRKSLSRCTA